MAGRHMQFKAGLEEGVGTLSQYILDNLHNTDEKDEALRNLIEVQMWAERCANLHGVKR